ncbi:uncharacterized protein [Thunnus thynnus]|uniref:uncharacterized protein isoform X2 n=1 Tax=Thunnus thynnus TaxID=8237 RepID=UPI0035273325
MSLKRKISIVVLGTEDYLKKSLKSLILGRDVSPERDTDKYEVTLTPNLYTPSDDIKNTFSQKNFDMCLLVVADDVSPKMVQEQIEKLQEKTGKSKKEFTVVLPLGCKNTDSYLASCSLGELFTELDKDRPMIPINKRDTDPPPLQPRMKVVRYIKEFFTDHKKSLKMRSGFSKCV